MSVAGIVAFGMTSLSIAAVGTYIARRVLRAQMEERAAITDAAFATLGVAGAEAATAAVAAAAAGATDAESATDAAIPADAETALAVAVSDV